VSTFDVGTITGIGVQYRGASAYTYLDEIRVGDSFADVMGLNAEPPNYFGPGNGSVNLAGGSATVVMSGIEGYNYAMQRSTNVLFTLGVSNFPTATAPVGGGITVMDDFSDLGAVPGSAFYRLQYIP
jgi:hypothetical protein